MLRKFLVALISVVVVTGCAADDGASGGASASADGSAPESTTPVAWEPEFVDGVLQPLPDGFPSQDITLLQNDEPSSADGLYVRAFQQALADISPVPIRILDQPGGHFGSWEGLKFAEEEPGGAEGHMPVVSSFIGGSLDFLVEPIEQDLGLTFEQVPDEVVIATEKVPFILITRADAPWANWDEMVEYGKANPGELRYITQGPGSGIDIAMQSLMTNAGGLEVNAIPLGDSVEIVTAVAAGEGDFAMMPVDPVIGQWEAGRVRVLMVVGEEAPEPWTDADTTGSLGMDEPWGSVRGFLVPASTPDLHRQWLFELFKAGSEQSAYTDRIANTPGALALTFGPDEIMNEINTALEKAEPIIRELGIHIDDQ